MFFTAPCSYPYLVLALFAKRKCAKDRQAACTRERERNINSKYELCKLPAYLHVPVLLFSKRKMQTCPAPG